MATVGGLERRHLPEVDDPALAPFWDGCRGGELRIPRCRSCGSYVWYPQLTCRRCGSEDLAWSAVSGRGRLFTWVRVHRAFLPGYEPRVPFVTALVELEEAAEVRLATLLDVPPGRELRIGALVAVCFEKIDDRLTLPRFRVV